MSERAEVSVRAGANGTETLQRMDVSGELSLARAHDGDLRRTPPLFGLGFIEFATERREGERQRPIFGAFAEHTSLRKFVAQTFATELGVSTATTCARERADRPFPVKCDAHISEGEVDDVVSFLRFLAAPPHRIEEHQSGRNVFKRIGCGGCHVEYIHTTRDAPAPLRDNTVSAYSDLKVHYIGYDRAVRTAPLWGLNSFGPPYMHNAKAMSIEEAIFNHSGEARKSASAFFELSNSDKVSLMIFLKSL